jgi:hypothetical protein
MCPKIYVERSGAVERSFKIRRSGAELPTRTPEPQKQANFCISSGKNWLSVILTKTLIILIIFLSINLLF